MGGTGAPAKNKLKTHCKHGHIFDEENTYWTKKGRQCKECRREVNRRKLLKRHSRETCRCLNCKRLYKQIDDLHAAVGEMMDEARIFIEFNPGNTTPQYWRSGGRYDLCIELLALIEQGREGER
jgi:hypothetical protein